MLLLLLLATIAGQNQCTKEFFLTLRFFFFKEKIYFKKVFLAMVETTISGHAIDSNAT